MVKGSHFKLSIVGKRFRLRDATVAVDESSGDAVAFAIPKGATITVIDDPAETGDRFLDVLWQDRPYAVFLADLEEYGEEIAEEDARARQ